MGLRKSVALSKKNGSGLIIDAGAFGNEVGDRSHLTQSNLISESGRKPPKLAIGSLVQIVGVNRKSG